MGTTKPRHCPASGTIHVWVQIAAGAQPKKLVLLGAKVEQANAATKNLGAKRVGRQNGTLRSEGAYQAASFREPGS